MLAARLQSNADVSPTLVGVSHSYPGKLRDCVHSAMFSLIEVSNTIKYDQTRIRLIPHLGGSSIATVIVLEESPDPIFFFYNYNVFFSVITCHRNYTFALLPHYEWVSFACAAFIISWLRVPDGLTSCRRVRTYVSSCKTRSVLFWECDGVTKKMPTVNPMDIWCGVLKCKEWYVVEIGQLTSNDNILQHRPREASSLAYNADVSTPVVT